MAYRLFLKAEVYCARPDDRQLMVDFVTGCMPDIMAEVTREYGNGFGNVVISESGFHQSPSDSEDHYTLMGYNEATGRGKWVMHLYADRSQGGVRKMTVKRLFDEDLYEDLVDLAFFPPTKSFVLCVKVQTYGFAYPIVQACIPGITFPCRFSTTFYFLPELHIPLSGPCSLLPDSFDDCRLVSDTSPSQQSHRDRARR